MGLGWPLSRRVSESLLACASDRAALQLHSKLSSHALQALKARVSNLPAVKKFLQPGSQRKPPTDEKIIEVRKVFRF